MTTHNTLTCLFGHHDYSEELTKDKYRTSIHLCKICKRSGYYKWDSGTEVRRNYDKEGNLIYSKYSGGFEVWHDEEGNEVYTKWGNGNERWKGNNGDWVKEKPKNWKYAT